MSKFKSFLKDTGGNYAMITALLAGPLMGGLAISVDVAEMSRQRAQVMATLDATNIAAARYLLAGVTVDTSKSASAQEAEREAKVKAYALSYFNATLPSVDPKKVALVTTVPKTTQDSGLINKATLTYDPYFAPVAMMFNGLTGTGDIKMPLEAEVSLENTVELAMVLDNSGSMSYYGTGSSKRRIVLLRDAAKKLVSRLSQRGSMMKQVEKPVQISLVPFAGSVNINPTNAAATWMDTEGRSPVHHENFTWPLNLGTNKDIKISNGVYKKIGTGWATAERNQIVTRLSMVNELKITKSGGTKPYTTWQGCVESRPYPMNVNDTPPSTSDYASYFVPMFGPDEAGSKNSGQNSWWADEDGSNDKEKQAHMKKYFTVQSSSTAALGWNVSEGDGDIDNGYRGPNYGCTTTPVIPLTDVSIASKKTELDAAIDAMKPLGSTNVPEGMAWGWRTLSPAEPFTGGRSPTVEGNLKVLLVLTDGANTYYARGDSTNKSTYGAYGYAGKGYNGGSETRLFKGSSVSVSHSDDQYTKAMNSHFSTLCTNAKAANLIVMTVALELDAKVTADKNQMDLLKACSSPSKVRRDANGAAEKLFWNSTAGSLEKDFEQIADELSNLRITG